MSFLVLFPRSEATLTTRKAGAIRGLRYRESP
jgi:hypothetical protein